MKKQFLIKKIFISLFLSVSLVLIVGHAVIPHHHHTDILLSHETDHCASDNSGEGNSKDLPFHCHAFNELNWVDNSDDNELYTHELEQITITAYSQINFKIFFDINLSAFEFVDIPLNEQYFNCQKGRRAPPEFA